MFHCYYIDIYLKKKKIQPLRLSGIKFETTRPHRLRQSIRKDPQSGVGYF